MPAYSELPRELWDEITSHLPNLSAFNAGRAFNFEATAYDKVWNAVFKTEQWHESAGGEHANIVLIGADLDILSGTTKGLARPHLVLTAFDRAGDLQHEGKFLHSSLRGTYNGPGEYQLEQLALTVGGFDVPEVLGKDFRYLFSKNGQQLQTKYCYWKDPKKKIRTLETQDIYGIGGPITKAKDLDPIFLLNLHPPVQRLPDYMRLLKSRRTGSNVSKKLEQFIFRSFGGESFWTGHPPLVDCILGETMDSGEYTINGFLFKDKKYEKYRYRDTDWIKVAETESRHECDIILV